MTDLISFTSSAVSGKVVGFRGTEAMSRPYQFEIFVQTTGEFDLKSAIGAKATMVVDRATEGFVPFFFAGVLADVEVVYAFEAQILVRVQLVPKLWQLGLSRHSRIFTRMRIPDIITQVLGENGISEYELRLSGSYDTEEHVCQYRESDLDFISRWMEKEGIFYFFEHGPDGEKLVLCDSTTYDHDPVGMPVPYVPQLGQDQWTAPHFRSFTGKQRTLPTQVRLTDYDYTKPNLQLTGNAPVQSNGAGQVVLYGERFFNPSTAQKYTKLRAEELLAREAMYKGTGTRLHLRPGYVFDLEGHPFGSFNGPYLAIEARHSANQAGGHAAFRELMEIPHEDVYRVEVQAIPAKTQFRAESLTAWPRIYGFENGVVDGPADSPYAQMDEQGRYNAKFNFDESSLQNGQASTFVRMMQPHGGDVEGFHFPLRKQTEIVFCFLDGDVDRPVIFGVVPNAVKPSPVTQSNYTKNVLQTGGRNRLEIEDLSGSQWMHLTTPSDNTHLFLGAVGEEGDHNFVLETEGTGHIRTGQKMDVDVGGPLTETIGGVVTEEYGNSTSQTVQGHKSHMVEGGQTETVLSGSTQTIYGFSQRMIMGPYTNMIMGPHTQLHTALHDQVHSGTHVHTHTGDHVHNQTGNLQRTRNGITKEILNGLVDRTVSSDVWETITGNVNWKISGDVEINCQEWSVHTKSKVHVRSAGISIEFSAGEKIELFGGVKNEFVGGMKREVLAGAKASMALGEKTDIVVGHKTEGAWGGKTDLHPKKEAFNPIMYNQEAGIWSVGAETISFFTPGVFNITAAEVTIE